jgi:hypothetical protein
MHLADGGPYIPSSPPYRPAFHAVLLAVQPSSGGSFELSVEKVLQQQRAPHDPYGGVM